MTKHEDFGEKIGGARKDLWSLRGLLLSDLEEMNAAERDKYVTKDNVWRKPDYQKLMAEGLPPRVAYFVKAVRDSLPAGPTCTGGMAEADVAARQDKYVEFVGSVRDAAMALKADSDIEGFFRRNFEPHLVRQGWYSVKVAEDYVGLITNKVLHTASLENMRALDAAIQKKQFGYTPEQKALDGYMLRQYGEDDAKFVSEPGERPHLVVEVGYGKHYFYPRDEMANPANWKPGTWFAAKNGRVVAYNVPSLEKLKEDVVALEAAKAALKPTGSRKGRFVPPQLAHVRFTGADVRQGRDVNGDDYMSAFRFRGGEFGNWMSDGDRQTSLNMGYEALATMAKALGISREDISLGGRLAIAFGARGQGAAAAHYEPMREVINLTKMHGAGSLAHEWGHAMDDILAKAIGGDGLSDGKARRGLTDAQSRLHHDMRFTEKQVDVEEQRAALEANTKRLSDYGERLIRSVMPAREKMEPEQARQQEELIARVVGDRTIRCNERLPSVQTVAGPVEELSEFKRSVTGRGIPKEFRENITYYLGMANSERAAMEHLEPRTELRPSAYYQESKDFGKKYSKTDHGYWESECEMFARAFACYVHDKLEAMGVICDYAVGHAESGPVPRGEERERLDADFDALIAEFKDRGLFHDYAEPELAPAGRETGAVQLTLDGLIADAEGRAGEQAAGTGKEQEL